MPFDTELLKNYPCEPGVYIMKNDKKEILYIGKAKDLKSRIKQYFFSSNDTREMIPFLIAQVSLIETIVTFNEKEALILESNLIKQHKPRYNVLLKDDKTFISLMINHQHEWPMLKLVRYKGTRPDDGLYFGPYPSTYSARKTLEVLQKVFPLRQCSDYELEHRKKPCLLYDMKRCLAPCVKRCSKQVYDETMKKALLFLKGKDDTVLIGLKNKIEDASKALEFEQAQALFAVYQQVKEIFEHHQFVVQMQVEDCDVVGYTENGPKAMAVILKFRDGKLVESRTDFLPYIMQDKQNELTGYLLQHYQVHAPASLILLPFVIDDATLLSDLLKETYKKNVDFTIPLKGNKKALLEMAEKNVKVLFEQHLKMENDAEALLAELEEKLKLNRLPLKIECFDTSNLANLDAVASMVGAQDGKIDKKGVRLFKIKNTKMADDYTAMKEVLYRRYERALKDDDLPDLIVIDGGKGQLNLAANILKELNIASCDVIGLAKEESRHDKGMTKEKVYILHQSEPIEFSIRSPLLFFLQKLRDEAHRVAIGYQRKVRSKRTIKSGLDSIGGIGDKKKKNLLLRFGSLKQIASATDEEILSVQGITKKDLISLRAYFESFKEK